MGELNLRWPALFNRAITLGAITLLFGAVAACSPNLPVPENGKEIGSNLPDETQKLGEAPISNGIQLTGATQVADVLQVPEFDVAAFARINPDPELRVLEPEVNPLGGFAFSDEERIPRDAINPVYSPKFVSPGEVALNPEELVMGLEIDGDARAYPVGMMRIREMVNDRVGGTPVLVTW
ncbi:MAG: DUF3179 domain-containing protein [Proteobacteria bacterium]|nr:DUF3179 domain-containing protein [Pseudomonadota bacterium]